MTQEPLTITVISICYNVGDNIRPTIESVIAQDYEHIDYVIIDGASTDNTLEIVREYEDKITMRIFSEPDSGISDAMNKGIEKAEGAFLIHLHAGDTLHDSNVLSKAVESYKKQNWQWATGAIDYVDEKDNTVIANHFPLAKGYLHKRLYQSNPINHQSTFIETAVFKEHGLFDTNYEIAMDYEYWLRVHKKIAAPALLHFPVANMLMSGLSATARVKGALECSEARKAHLGPIKPGFYFIEAAKVSYFWLIKTIEVYTPRALVNGLKSVKRKVSGAV